MSCAQVPLSSSHLDTPPAMTSNNLGDIIKWLRNDAYVVIHATNGRFFHKCTGNMTEEQREEYFQTHKVIYVDVSHHESLLDKGEWEHYITAAGFDECSCNLKNRVSKFEVPHQHRLSLGY